MSEAEGNSIPKTQTMRVPTAVRDWYHTMAEKYGLSIAELSEVVKDTFDAQATGMEMIFLPELQMAAAGMEISLQRLSNQLELMEELAVMLQAEPFDISEL